MSICVTYFLSKFLHKSCHKGPCIASIERDAKVNASSKERDPGHGNNEHGISKWMNDKSSDQVLMDEVKLFERDRLNHVRERFNVKAGNLKKTLGKVTPYEYERQAQASAAIKEKWAMQGTLKKRNPYSCLFPYDDALETTRSVPRLCCFPSYFGKET